MLEGLMLRALGRHAAKQEQQVGGEGERKGEHVLGAICIILG